MGRYPIHRSDVNQKEIVDRLRKAGVIVHLVNGAFDAVAKYRGKLKMLEFKRDGKAQLTDDQVKLFADFGDSIVRIETANQALVAMGVINPSHPWQLGGKLMVDMATAKVAKKAFDIA